MNKVKLPPAVQRVFDYMLETSGITSLDAIREFGNTRLSASIYYLQHKAGVSIVSEYKVSKNRYGDVVKYKQYSLLGQ